MSRPGEPVPRPGPPAEAFVTALASLPWATHRVLTRLLGSCEPADAWQRVRTGRAGLPPALAERWRAASGTVDVAAVWAAHLEAGVDVSVPGAGGFPPALACEEEPEPPAVLFRRGSAHAASGDGMPSVAIVGTRRCTQYGRDVARELGHDLAAAGVRVVSGLALGIDAAAHAGALLAGGAPPLGVVGSGLDVVYPPRNRDLWARVAAAGAIVGESPLGTRPEPWRFPLRNRLIAALSAAVVVVESHPAGGSMHTVDAAAARGRTVMAVPGPVRSRASAGANRLIADGAAPALDAGDVLVALGLGGRSPGPRPDPRPPPDRDGRLVLDALGWEPATLEEVAARLGVPIGPAALHLDRLARDGWVARQGSWFERRALP